MIHAGHEGSYHCRKKIYIPLYTVVIFFFCDAHTRMNQQKKHFNVVNSDQSFNIRMSSLKVHILEKKYKYNYINMFIKVTNLHVVVTKTNSL